MKQRYKKQCEGQVDSRNATEFSDYVFPELKKDESKNNGLNTSMNNYRNNDSIL